jgi:hypothetical protein
MLEDYQVAAQLVAFRVVLSSTELVRVYQQNKQINKTLTANNKPYVFALHTKPYQQNTTSNTTVYNRIHNKKLG